ncbi:MAG: hypothetical protein JSS75_05820 [Bacteroidetes bacterium]|nr:hypothetical protein [Bacteroidota bacterium]
MTILTRSIIVASIFLVGCSKKQAEDDSAAPASGYSVENVTSGGSVSGHVMLVGEHPATSMLETQKDQDVCGTSHPNPGALGSGNGIGGCVVAIEHISKGKAFVEQKWEVDQKGCEFIPHILAVPVGKSIVVANSDAALHNFHITKGTETIVNEAQPESSPAREVKMKTPGLLAVTCDVHPWMRGYVYVAENPYYAVTDAQGSYSITDIPAGDYTISLWRDNWTVELVKDGEGRIQSYKRGPDFVKQQQVHIEAGKPVSLDFTLP